MSIYTSCQRSANAEITPIQLNSHQAYTLKDVSYGQDTAQRMDIYLPANRSVDSTKSIILIHGGGWTNGSKNDFLTYIDSFHRRMPDYAIFNINYRLVDGINLFPTQENDVKAAMDFIIARTRQYGISKDKLVLLGVSAGGHLALLQAYKYKQPGIKAVIDFFGPTDLTAMYQKPWHPYVPMVLQMITGTSPRENAKLYRESSPLNYVSRHAAPTLIFHGSADQIVNVSQSKALRQQLEKWGVPNELVIYPGQRHGWYGSTLTNSFDRMEKFLDEHVN